MADDASQGVFVVGQHGTTEQAGGVNAVMARRGDRLLQWHNAIAALWFGRQHLAKQRANFAPRFAVIQPI